jgi:hypothetical protein
MIKNMRIPRYKPPITIPRADSEISDGTTPVLADSEARVDRFSQKRKFISDRADNNLYFPVLTFGRGDSDASRRFGTWGIESYNQIKGLSILRVKNFRSNQKTGRLTSANLPFPAGGIRRPHPRLIIGGRGCGNGWSLHAIVAADGRPTSCRPQIQIFTKKQFFRSGDYNSI